MEEGTAIRLVKDIKIDFPDEIIIKKGTKGILIRIEDDEEEYPYLCKIEGFHDDFDRDTIVCDLEEIEEINV